MEDNRTLELRVALNERSVQENRDAIIRLDKCINGNGKPGIEDRMSQMVQVLRVDLMAELARVKRHSEANMEEGDQLLAHEMERETTQQEKRNAQQERQHETNMETLQAISKKVDNQSMMFMAIAVAFSIVKALEMMGIIHFAGK